MVVQFFGRDSMGSSGSKAVCRRSADRSFQQAVRAGQYCGLYRGVDGLPGELFFPSVLQSHVERRIYFAVAALVDVSGKWTVESLMRELRLEQGAVVERIVRGMVAAGALKWKRGGLVVAC